jgi:hypothetical protein
MYPAGEVAAFLSERGMTSAPKKDILERELRGTDERPSRRHHRSKKLV